MEAPFYDSLEMYQKEVKMNTKRWFHSKTLWINGLVFVGCLISGVTGENWLDGETQLMVLALADFILRMITKSGLEK